MAPMTFHFVETHDATGCMAYPPGTTISPGEAHASVYVCEDEDCQRMASEWVESITGHEGIYEPFAAHSSEGD